MNGIFQMQGGKNRMEGAWLLTLKAASRDFLGLITLYLSMENPVVNNEKYFFSLKCGSW
jgi:hypothetical protein